MKILWYYHGGEDFRFPGVEEVVTTEMDSEYMKNRQLEIYDLLDINSGINLGSSAVQYILCNPLEIIYPDTGLEYDEPFIMKKLTTMNTLSDEHRVFIKLKYGDMSDIDVGLSHG